MNTKLLDTILRSACRNNFAPSFSVLVKRKMKTEYQGDCGNHIYDATSHGEVPLKIYDIASITKAVVATGALLLIDQGKLKLNDKIDKFFPQLHKKYVGGQTIWNLLTHTSFFYGVRLSSFKNHLTLENVLRAVTSLEVNHKYPEKVVRYANVNTYLLGELISQITGERLDKFLGNNLFLPLEMKETMFNPPAIYWNRIPPTSFADEKEKQRKVHDPSARLAGGICGHAGLFSTVRELNNFLEMFMNHGSFRGRNILSPQIARAAIKNQTPGYNLQSGLGWHLDNESYLGPISPAGTFFHPGFTGTIIVGSPVSEVTMVFLSNYVYQCPDKLAKKRKLFQKIAKAVFAHK